MVDCKKENVMFVNLHQWTGIGATELVHIDRDGNRFYKIVNNSPPTLKRLSTVLKQKDNPSSIVFTRSDEVN